MDQFNRTWAVSAIATPEDLSAKLTQVAWKMCQGFQLGDILFLNLSTSSNGVQEYAVVAPWGSLLIHIESIELSLCSQDAVLRHIKASQDIAWLMRKTHYFPSPGWGCLVEPKLESIEGHSCFFCDSNEGRRSLSS